MGQIVSSAAKPKRCNLNQLSQVPTPAAGEYILVSSDNSMNAAGQGNFDCYIEGNGRDAATALELKPINELAKITLVKSKNLLDPSTLTSGSINATTGKPQAGNSYRRTPFIPVSTKGLYFNGGVKSSSYGSYVYDSEQQPLRANDSATTYIYQEGDAYVRFTTTAAKETAGGLQIEEGTSGTDYEAWFEPYYELSFDDSKINSLNGNVINDESVELQKFGASVTEIVVSKNLCDPEKLITGRSIDEDGSVAATTAAYYGYYKRLPVLPNTPYHLSASDGKGLYSSTYVEKYIAFYDEQENLLSTTSQRTTDIVTPANCHFMSVSVNIPRLIEPQIEEGTERTSYEEYFAPKPMLRKEIIPSDADEVEQIVANKLASEKIFDASIEISLPDVITAVVGDTLQVFYQGVVKSANWEKYWCRAYCSKGALYHRYWQYTPKASDVGTTTFQIIVTDDNENVIAQKSCQLVTVAAPSSPQTLKKIMPVGSSTTAGGQWPAEVLRRLTGTGGTPEGAGITNISLVGQMTKDGAGYIGKSGWSWSDYTSASRPAFRFTLTGEPQLSMGATYTNNGFSYTIIEIVDDTILCSTSSASNVPLASGTLTKSSGSGDATLTYSSVVADAQNPFWDSSQNKLSFTDYVDTYCGGSIDAVVVLLGWNGLNANLDPIMAKVKLFADTLHEEYPSAKLMLVGSAFPSLKLMMPVYGASGTLHNIYNDITLMANLCKAYQELANSDDYSSFVEYVDMSSQFDSDYNYPITMKDVNTRNSSYTEPYANNGVHPSNAGYMQYADVIYRKIVAEFCQ